MDIFQIRSRLGTKVVILISVVTTLVFVVGGIINFPEERRALIEQIDRNGQNQAFAISKAVIAPILYDDSRAVKEILKSLLGNKDIAFIRIQREDEPLIEVIAKKTALTNDYFSNIEIPVEAEYEEEPDILGKLELGIYREATDELLAERLKNYILTSVAVLMSVLGLAWFIIKWMVIIPLQSLGKQAIDLGGGNLESPITLDRIDELGRLASVMEGMRQSLQERDAKLQETMEELEVAMKKAEAASLAKSAFIAIMSHEQRTPLNSVISTIMLALKESVREKRVELLERALEGSQLALETINSILDFAKLERGSLELDYVDFSLVDRLRKIVGVFSSQTVEKGIRLDLQVDPNLPAIYGDDVRVGMIIQNLLGNAIKFTDSGQVTLQVEQKPCDIGMVNILIIVQDSGIGISEDKQDAIFESFTQADSSTTRKYGGTGLGLATAQKLVELMDGEIWLESVVGEGSRFFVRIPFQHSKSSIEPSDEVIPDLVAQDQATQSMSLEMLPELLECIAKLKPELEAGTTDDKNPDLQQIQELLAHTHLRMFVDLLKNRMHDFLYDEALETLGQIEQEVKRMSNKP